MGGEKLTASANVANAVIQKDFPALSLADYRRLSIRERRGISPCRISYLPLSFVQLCASPDKQSANNNPLDYRRFSRLSEVEKENSRLDRGNLALRRVLRGSTPFIDFPPVAFALEDETVQARR